MWRFPVLLALALGWGGLAAAEVREIDIQVANRAVVAPIGVLRCVQGDRLLLRWHSDEAADIHLHGYDRHLTLAAGKVTEMALDAVASGRFPITSHGFGGEHHGHRALLYLEVYPE